MLREKPGQISGYGSGENACRLAETMYSRFSAALQNTHADVVEGEIKASQRNISIKDKGRADKTPSIANLFTQPEMDESPESKFSFLTTMADETSYLNIEHRPVQIKSKIICTIGPKTQSVEQLGKLIEAGLTVARLNFSHGSHEYHAQTIANIRTYIKNSKNPRSVAILLDTKGPEIRTGKLDASKLGDETQAYTTYLELADSVKVGDRILVDDGLIGTEVIEVRPEAKEVVVRVENDGFIGENKGINLPGVTVQLPAITEKDAGDLQFGIEQGVDFIAASFIRKAADVLEIRRIIKGTNIKIISKIESQEGLDNFDEILAVSDGIMVARGDLGVEVPVETVARYQKMMIRKCNAAGKPVVTATQMLESMIVNPRPTRAEATDVANAVLDGSDCVMLSGETAKGAFPVLAVEMMAKICREAEADINYSELYPQLRRQLVLPISVSEAVASSAVKTSWDVHAALIIVLTQTGNTAQAICKYRPIAPVLAVTASDQVARHMEGTENIIHRAMLWGVKMGMAKRGDPVVVTSGVIESVAGSTNIMRVLKCVGFERD
ncbi:pyruvate kinase [Rhizoclosmatium globosum]|uniref:Pyruvate kinase n=1 Tax=Rhizoclosmatium globosum TaxID=329046 RepID=A0A1Y2CS94_9FUNG|nr:pyruvate kinase [Rhizoclosmatium globosum]|eukprot:ORY49843.1 pyruvate kinase [Rhizoclosmatium globosum]